MSTRKEKIMANSEQIGTVTRGVYRPFSTKNAKHRPIKVMIGASVTPGYISHPMQFTAAAVIKGKLQLGIGATESEALYDLAIAAFGYEWDLPYQVLA